MRTGAAGQVDVRTKCRQALFSIDPQYGSSRDLVFIFRISKLLQNEYTKDQEPFFNAKRLKPQAIAALSTEASMLLRNPQAWKYRAPFGWAMRPIFMLNGEVDQRASQLDIFALR